MQLNNQQKKEIIEYVSELKLRYSTDIWETTRKHFEKSYRYGMSTEAYRHIWRSRDKFEPLTKEDIQAEVEKLPKIESYVPNKEIFEIKNDGTSVSTKILRLSETDSKNPDSLLVAHGFDPKQFTLVSAVNNLWGNTSDEKLQNYQSKISVKPREERKDLTIDDIQDFMSDLLGNKFKHDFKLIPLDDSKEKYCLEIDWADIHLGSLSDEDEVGFNNDYKIAFGNIKKVVAKIVKILETGKVEKIVHCFLGDFLHFDNVEGKTAGGTELDTDSRPFKMIKKAFEIAMYIVDNTAIVPCEVKSVLGNHSKMVEFCVFWAMSLIYRDEKHITFDVNEKQRKVFSYGTSLIGLAHGNDIAKAEQDLWLQNEFRQEWANCDYAEVHTGHLHQEILFSEKGGITKRTNPTLKIIDKYESDHAWSSKKVVLAYLWHKTDNLQEIFYLK